MNSVWLLLTPLLLAGLLVRRSPRCRRFKPRSLFLYLLIMTGLIRGAMEWVGYAATAEVAWREVAIVLWFAVTWRLAWEVWSSTVGQAGQHWVRWGRWQRKRGCRIPLPIRLIPAGRMILTAAVFVPLFLSCVATRRCKFQDGQDPQSVFSIPYQAVRIPSTDDIELDGWFIPQQNANRTIIVCHGAGANKGNFVWFLAALAGHEWNILFFDFRAHGGSGGRITSYGIREQNDVIAAVTWLENNRPEQSQVIAGLGSSQGSLALALAAANDPRIDAIILDSPFVSPRALAHHHAQRLPVLGPAMADLFLLNMSLLTGTSFFDASAKQAVASLGRRPVMIIHGNQDAMMPASHARQLYQAAKGPREIWLGPGPHSNIVTTSPARYEQRLFRFLDHAFPKTGNPTPATGENAISDP